MGAGGESVRHPATFYRGCGKCHMPSMQLHRFLDSSKLPSTGYVHRCIADAIHHTMPTVLYSLSSPPLHSIPQHYVANLKLLVPVLLGGLVVLVLHDVLGLHVALLALAVHEITLGLVEIRVRPREDKGENERGDGEGDPRPDEVRVLDGLQVSTEHCHSLGRGGGGRTLAQASEMA